MSFRRFNLIAVSIAAALSAATAQAHSPLPPDQPSGSTGQAAVNGKPSSQSSPKKVVTLKGVSVKGHFISAKGHSALKMDVPARDTPFSISTYTGAFMHAVEAAKVDELYPYMTGIQSAGITGYDLVFRGFQSGANDQNSILVDGLPGLATRFGSPVTIGISRIDVV